MGEAENDDAYDEYEREAQASTKSRCLRDNWGQRLFFCVSAIGLLVDLSSACFFCGADVCFFSASVLVCTFTFWQATSTEAVLTELGVRSSDDAVFNITILVLVLLDMQQKMILLSILFLFCTLNRECHAVARTDVEISSSWSSCTTYSYTYAFIFAPEGELF